jgi:hypothetical protein
MTIHAMDGMGHAGVGGGWDVYPARIKTIRESVIIIRVLSV